MFFLGCKVLIQTLLVISLYTLSLGYEAVQRNYISGGYSA